MTDCFNCLSFLVNLSQLLVFRCHGQIGSHVNTICSDN